MHSTQIHFEENLKNCKNTRFFLSIYKLKGLRENLCFDPIPSGSHKSETSHLVMQDRCKTSDDQCTHAEKKSYMQPQEDPSTVVRGRCHKERRR